MKTGQFFTQPIVSALYGAASPSVSNVFATIADIKNIFNFNGLLTGNRTLNGDGYNLTFTSLLSFSVNTTGNISLSTGTANALVLPTGPDPAANVSSPTNGMIKYDNTNNYFVVYQAGAWEILSTGGGNTIYSADDVLAGTRTITANSFDLILSGGAGTGNLVLTDGHLHITQDASQATNPFNVSGSTISDIISIANNGKIGSRVSNPTAQLEVNGFQGGGGSKNFWVRFNSGILGEFAAVSNHGVGWVAAYAKKGTGSYAYYAEGDSRFDGDIRISGSSFGLILEDADGGGNSCRVIAKEVSPGIFELTLVSI